MPEQPFNNVARLIKNFEHPLLSVSEEQKNKIYDIRLKAGQPLVLYGEDGLCFLAPDGRVTKNADYHILYCGDRDIQDIFLHLCSHSIFSHENEIREGYITVNGTYRVGICGTAVMEKDKIKNIKDITSLTFRIPRNKGGCAKQLFYRKIDFSNGILVAGEPSSGKTTFLRDMAASLSKGEYMPAKRLAVVDERSEIAGGYDLGPGADVLKGYPKAEGIAMALRSLSPEIIVCDEITVQEMESVEKSLFSGVPLIASLHATYDTLLKRRHTRELALSGAFETIVFLTGRKNPAKIDKICTVGEIIETDRNRIGHRERSDDWADRRNETEKKRSSAA